jgi:hypothetical protein
MTNYAIRRIFGARPNELLDNLTQLLCVICYRLDDQNSIPCSCNEIFFVTTSIPDLRSIKPLVQWMKVALSRRVNWPELKADQLPSSVSEVYLHIPRAWCSTWIQGHFHLAFTTRNFKVCSSSQHY